MPKYLIRLKKAVEFTAEVVVESDHVLTDFAIIAEAFVAAGNGRVNWKEQPTSGSAIGGDNPFEIDDAWIKVMAADRGSLITVIKAGAPTTG